MIAEYSMRPEEDLEEKARRERQYHLRMAAAPAMQGIDPMQFSGLSDYARGQAGIRDSNYVIGNDGVKAGYGLNSLKAVMGSYGVGDRYSGKYASKGDASIGLGKSGGTSGKSGSASYGSGKGSSGGNSGSSGGK